MEADKATIRKQMLNIRQRLTASALNRCSKSICRRLLSLSAVEQADSLVLYAAFGKEVNLKYLIDNLQKREKDFLLPRFDPKAKRYQLVAIRNLQEDTLPGKYGILEPRTELIPIPERCTRQKNVTWIIPGVAFDEKGKRLGRGGGYYDRLLNQVQGCKVGVAMEKQIMPFLPVEDHDISMNLIITEDRIIHTPQSPYADKIQNLRPTGPRANPTQLVYLNEATLPDHSGAAPITREVSL